MTHLTPDELVDAVEDVLDTDRREHLTTCAMCRASVDDFARLLQHTRDIAVPEPSSLFWDHFSRRIRAAVASESSPRAGAAEWWRWPVLVPLGALAALVTMLAGSMPRSLDPNQHALNPDQQAIAATGDALPVPDEDMPWTFLAEVVGDVSLDAAQRAGLVIAPGVAERALDQLTAAERDELLRLLNSALARPES